MLHSIPVEIKIFPKGSSFFKEFFVSLNVTNHTMIFLSENCYDWLKENSIYMENPITKVFRLRDNPNDTATYIETINIVSSNCSFLKNIFSNDYNYDYSNGIPKKIIILSLEDEKSNFDYNISAYNLESGKTDNPVNCIIDSPQSFEDSIVFLNSNSYERLEKNTNTISNVFALERLIWSPDNDYPGGNIMLHCLTHKSLYMICDMKFPFFTKSFHFDKVPKLIYFIS